MDVAVGSNQHIGKVVQHRVVCNVLLCCFPPFTWSLPLRLLQRSFQFQAVPSKAICWSLSGVRHAVSRPSANRLCCCCCCRPWCCCCCQQAHHCPGKQGKCMGGGATHQQGFWPVFLCVSSWQLAAWTGACQWPRWAQLANRSCHGPPTTISTGSTAATA